MNRTQKLEFQEEIEAYLEDNGVYEMFESLMISLVKDKPADPLQFLVQKLEKPERKELATNSYSQTHCHNGTSWFSEEGVCSRTS